jgi:hypothetical protein
MSWLVHLWRRRFVCSSASDVVFAGLFEWAAFVHDWVGSRTRPGPRQVSRADWRRPGVIYHCRAPWTHALPFSGSLMLVRELIESPPPCDLGW